jgi:hypothetical protein
MAYQPWLPTVNYPIDSIVTYEGVPYQATIYHLSTNTEPPNVEVRTVDALFGPQRGWTVYERPQPAGSFGAIQTAKQSTTKKPFDPDDDWGGPGIPDNEVQQGPYGVGISDVDFQGTTNNPSFQCPKGDCHVAFTDGSIYTGGVTTGNIVTIQNPVLTTLPSGQTYYANGALSTSNTLYVFYTHTGSWAVKRTFEFTMEVITSSGTEIEIRTVTGQEKFYVQTPIFPYVQPYPPFTAYDTPYFAPGNEVFTVSYGDDLIGSPSIIKLTNVY